MFIICYFSLLSEINYAFKPDALVIQCGADCLSHDPLGGFNLTPFGIAHCMSKDLELEKPTLILGGGGYNLPNAARFWTYLTHFIVRGEKPNDDIPDTHPDFDKFGPSFEISISPGRRQNLNTNETLSDCLEEAFRNLEELP